MADKTLVIDTTLLIDYFRKTDKSKSRLVQLSEQFDRLAISTVTEFEVYSGAIATQSDFWNELLSEFLVLPFDSRAAHIAVDIQRDLKRLSKSIEKADLFIAATAVANGLTLDN
ncbi:type II toxin-antitoxin system VapC family toxin [Mucilaginibacter sp.]|uniref:type II toxin-antitoxin system VapC family toxin n=1 Tax=Mucilaginibacter sp. TaxID=1882438 RepID=UPI003AFFF4B0